MEYTNSQIRTLIDEHIHHATDRQMLYMRLVDGRTFEEISEQVQLDPKTVRKRIHKAEEILFAHLPG